MYKPFLRTAVVLGALAVILGAFGAHALKSMVSETAVNTFDTGVRYQFYHVFALALAAIMYSEMPGKWVLWSGRLFLIGMLLFSGSLYLLTFFAATAKSGFRWIGAITPFGGLALIAGWVCLLIALMNSPKKLRHSSAESKN